LELVEDDHEGALLRQLDEEPEDVAPE